MEVYKFRTLVRIPLLLIFHRFSIKKQFSCYNTVDRFTSKGHSASKTKEPFAAILKNKIIKMPPSIIHFSKFNADSPVGALQKEGSSFVSDVAVLERSAECLKNGGVVAVPTDTVYGVACLAQNTAAINRIYAIKNRNYHNPIAISVSTIKEIHRWSNVTVCNDLLKTLLPGPVTLVFERKPDLNPALNPLTNLVGIRIPNNRFMQDLAEQCGGPIALTSANLSGTKSCLQIEEFESLWCQLDLVVNGGKLNNTEEARLGSTVVDLSVPQSYRIIRPGSAHRPTVECLEKFGLKEFTQTL